MIDDGATRTLAGSDPDAPLLVVLHGYGASESDLLPLAPHLGHPGDVAFLRAPLPLGPGWAWFPITTIGNPDVAAVRAASDALLVWIDAHAAGRDVVLLGFSQGSTVALEALRTRPSGIRAVVVLSGFVSPVPHPGDDALAALGVPTFFGHGDADPVIPPVVTSATSAWLAAHTAATEHAYPGLPHGVDQRVLADVTGFLREVAARG